MKTTTAELTSGAQMQRGKPVIWRSCHLRIEPGGNITVHTPLACFLLPLPAFTRKHAFPVTKLLHVLQNNVPGKKNEVRAKKCFCQVYTVFQFFPAQSNHLNSMHILFTDADILLPCFISDLRFCFYLCVRVCCACLNPNIAETAILLVCAFMLFFGLLCDSLSDHCIRFSSHLQESPHAPWT